MRNSALRSPKFTPSPDGMTEIATIRLDGPDVDPFNVHIERPFGDVDSSVNPEVDLVMSGWGISNRNTGPVRRVLARRYGRTTYSIDQAQPGILDVSGVHHVGPDRVKRIAVTAGYILDNVTDTDNFATLAHSRSAEEQYLAMTELAMAGRSFASVMTSVAPVGFQMSNVPEKAYKVCKEGVINEIPRFLTKRGYLDPNDELYGFIRYNAKNFLATVRLGIYATRDNVESCVPFLNEKGVYQSLILAERDQIADDIDEPTSKLLGFKKYKKIPGEDAIHNVHVRLPGDVAQLQVEAVAERRALIAALNYGFTKRDMELDLNHGVE